MTTFKVTFTDVSAKALENMDTVTELLGSQPIIRLHASTPLSPPQVVASPKPAPVKHRRKSKGGPPTPWATSKSGQHVIHTLLAMNGETAWIDTTALEDRFAESGDFARTTCSPALSRLFYEGVVERQGRVGHRKYRLVENYQDVISNLVVQMAKPALKAALDTTVREDQK